MQRNFLEFLLLEKKPKRISWKTTSRIPGKKTQRKIPGGNSHNISVGIPSEMFEGMHTQTFVAILEGIPQKISETVLGGNS